MMFAGGTYVSPVAGENLQEHIALHQAALMDPVLPANVKSMLQCHMQETQQLQMAQQMAQMLQQRPSMQPQGPQAPVAAQGMGPMPGQPPMRTSPGAGMAQRG